MGSLWWGRSRDGCGRAHFTLLQEIAENVANLFKKTKNRKDAAEGANEGVERRPQENDRGAHQGRLDEEQEGQDREQKSEKNKENNLAKGGWLRSKGDKFLSKGLKPENIVRKGKRKAFKKPDGRTPEISKDAPAKVGEKPKNKTNIDIGNIVTRPKRKRKKRVLYNAS